MQEMPNVTAAGRAQQQDGRDAQRAALLLAASIEAGALNAPVRIRNLSESGAALEGDVLPGAGAAIILRRLDLAVPGVVVWTSRDRCGVHFDAPTNVTEWITGRRGATGPLPDQTRVDLIQAAVKSGSTILSAPPVVSAADAGAEIDARLAAELGFVRDLLERLGDALTDEPVLLTRHATALQSFDLAGQILGHVASVLVASDRSAAIDEIGMEEVRARLRGKPRN
jgi:hypothetical protein